MSTPTQVPAFEAKVGDWEYYVCLMSYAEVARQVNFAYELGANKELGSMIQRGIATRTQEITAYLLENPSRFLGAIVVAAWGGNPNFMSVEIAHKNELMPGLDDAFGVLVFDGDQQYFALDGQHWLRAIKDAILKDPSLGSEKITVIMVTHMNDPEGRRRTRRLFTNINRRAKTTSKQENIALDEDDGFAIVTRELINAHHFLSQDGVVRVFSRELSETGEIKLATAVIPKTDPRAWTSLGTLYGLLQSLGFGLNPQMRNQTRRPDDETIDSSVVLLGTRIDQLLKACGNLEDKLAAAGNARAVRVPKAGEQYGHPLMRPVVQKVLGQVLAHVVGDQQRITWDEALQRLSTLPWQLGEAPWIAVFGEGGQMLAGSDNQDLLEDLLEAHLAPTTKKQIADARKKYKDVRGVAYPVQAEVLEALIPAS